MTIAVEPPAKLNLALAVGRPDGRGMHPICSWMVTISLCDLMVITRLPRDRLSRYAIGWHADAPRPGEIDWPTASDLAVRAHLALERHVKRSLPVQLKLDKRIPVGGGLGGGSSDAAATLRVVNELFEKVAEPTIDPARPTFVTDFPSALSPLTRPHADDPGIAQRWDLFIAGMEIGPAYTELNDPDIQESKFKEQLKGIDDEESTFRTLDEDFLRALKVGMPPAGGLGLGIDRIVMLLTNQRTIRDVILFPLMRPAN